MQIQLDPIKFEASTDAPMPTLKQLQDAYIAHVLVETRGKKTKAARILGVNRRTLYRRDKPFSEIAPEAQEAAPEAQDAVEAG